MKKNPETELRFALELLNGASLKSPPVQQATQVLQALVDALDDERRELYGDDEGFAPGSESRIEGDEPPSTRPPEVRSTGAFGPPSPPDKT